jgi:hypothetical protein
LGAGAGGDDRWLPAFWGRDEDEEACSGELRMFLIAGSASARVGERWLSARLRSGASDGWSYTCGGAAGTGGGGGETGAGAPPEAGGGGGGALDGIAFVRGWAMPVVGPRLCGNWSGRGREWVRSNRPHLLQSCWLCARQRLREKSDVKPWVAHHFAGVEARPAPCGRLGRAAVEASPADAVAQLGCRVVGVDDLPRVRRDGRRRDVHVPV